MAITVIVPRALLPYVAHNERVAIEATTAGEALRKLIERYPDVQTQIPADLQQMPAGYAIYRNSQDLRRLQGLDTELRNDDRLTIIVPRGDM